jgi:hypothetical protein
LENFRNWIKESKLKTVEVYTDRHLDENGEADISDVVFVNDKGEAYRMYHEQDCCECVIVNEIHAGVEITDCEEFIFRSESEWGDSATHSFFKLIWHVEKPWKRRCEITIHWLGTSNGYYGEGVSLVEMREKTNE